MNALLTPDVTDRLLEIVRSARPTAVAIGMPGLRDREKVSLLVEDLSQAAGCPVQMTADAHIAVLGAFLGSPGIVVIAGTGSAAAGWDGQRWVHAGGHGFLLGDEGSGYWLGRAAARAALRWEDRLGGSELIHRTVTQTVGSNLDDLITDVNTHPAQRDRLTVLAPAITALAADDLEARRITERAAEDLAAMAESIRCRLGPLPVSGAGGVFRSPLLWQRFVELTGATRPLATPAVGAALLTAGTVRVPPYPDA